METFLLPSGILALGGMGNKTQIAAVAVAARDGVFRSAGGAARAHAAGPRGFCADLLGPGVFRLFNPGPLA